MACDFVGPCSVTDRKKANDYVFKEKTKRTIDKFSRNRLFNVGDVVLVKKVGGKKFEIKGEECEIVQQIDFKSVIVKNNSTGRVFRISIDRISLVSNEDDEHAANDERVASNETPRKSPRVRFAPDRLVYR